MIETSAIAAIGADGTAPLITRLGLEAQPLPAQAQGDFASILSTSLDNINAKIANADDLVRRFALDDNVPVHQVTYALEEARLSVELAMQVRQRLVESYRELMNMQL
ncbi:MAG: flagellar hook-basal body complex protein FliE [Novosphingobium sp.]|nr:flagellar hook-basal body complex protein FliE [Novosphingobium sp.]